MSNSSFRAWQKANPEKNRERARDWAAINRERSRANARNYAAAFPVEYRIRQEKWRRDNPNSSKTWHIINRERCRIYSKNWESDHPGRGIINSHKRRARIAGNGGHFTIMEWEHIKGQFNYQCPSCGEKEPNIKLTIDHIIPISKGGNNYIKNIQPLCLKCNLKKRTQVINFKTTIKGEKLR